MADMKEQYRTVMDDHFPPEVKIEVGGTVLRFRKRAWKLPDSDGQLVEKGLRYGENPGQEAALYELVNGALSVGEVRLIEPGRGLVSALDESQMLQAGKHPGKTNLTDVDNALHILRYLTDQPTAAIMKHNNPSGVARAGDIATAYHRAFMADLIAAFGGAAVLNRPVDKAAAEMMAELYLEVVAAPDYEEGVLDILAQRKNLRILSIPRMDRLSEWRDLRFLDIKSLMDGGIILQTSSFNRIAQPADLLPARCEHKGQVYEPARQPTARELDDVVFGWAVEQGVTSNSVIYVKDGCTVGIGTGEQDRVGVARIAVDKAYNKYANRLAWERHGLKYDELCQQVEAGQHPESELDQVYEDTMLDRAGLGGAVMISDAFFPFRDGVDVGLAQGVSCIAHPGGSLRDWESIEACNQADPPVAMVFTGQRAFKH
ncbi:MAG: IMP cyclohydrolase [Deltaproteobacteria bacterium]|nr:IMP cyclohydrolase [Deltaproteobacteria bacterium]